MVPCGFLIQAKCGLVGVATFSYPAGAGQTYWYRPTPTGELNLVGYEERKLCDDPAQTFGSGVFERCSGQVPPANCTADARCNETCARCENDGDFFGAEQPCSLSDLFGDLGVPGGDAGHDASVADASPSTDAM